MWRVFQFKISLDGIKPQIWRRFLAADSMAFHNLHEIIQVVMGWKNYHLYEFQIKQFHFGVPEDKNDKEVTNAKKAKLADFIETPNQKFRYVYDFGDDWGHTIILEKILEKELPDYVPMCLSGERACPPEDCEGIPGYYELTEAVADKKHPRYKELLQWLGKPFDSEEFDVNKVNRKLGAKKFKSRDWLLVEEGDK